MINVPEAILALGCTSVELARELHVSPFIVEGWQDGAQISSASVRALRGYVEARLRAHLAFPVYPDWRRDESWLRQAYDCLTPDPDAELVSRVRASMRAAGSLMPLLPLPVTISADQMLAAFRHPRAALHDRIDRAFQ